MSKVEGFAAVPNWMIRDESFDIYDIAVYAALASHTGPGGVRPSQETLAREARCSVRRVRTALQSLTERGVVQIVRRRRKGDGIGKHGALSNGYVLMPHGPLSEEDEFATTDQPAHGADRSSTNRHATTDQPAQESNGFLYIEEEPVKEEPLESSAAPFDAFWAVWPRKDAKKNALAAWAKAVKNTNPQVIVDAAVAYASSPYVPEVRFVPYAATWLNGERWNDPLPSAPANGKQSAVEAGRGALALLAQRRELEAVTS